MVRSKLIFPYFAASSPVNEFDLTDGTTSFLETSSSQTHWNENILTKVSDSCIWYMYSNLVSRISEVLPRVLMGIATSVCSITVRFCACQSGYSVAYVTQRDGDPSIQTLGLSQSRRPSCSHLDKMVHMFDLLSDRQTLRATNTNFWAVSLT